MQPCALPQAPRQAAALLAGVAAAAIVLAPVPAALAHPQLVQAAHSGQQRPLEAVSLAVSPPAAEPGALPEERLERVERAREQIEYKLGLQVRGVIQKVSAALKFEAVQQR